MSANSHSSPRSKFVWYWLPAILYAGAIFFVSSIHHSFRHPTFPANDKLFHLAEYGILAWLWFRAISFGTKFEKRWVAVLALSITAACGGLDEWYQTLNPVRSSDPLDFLADLFGGVLALAVSMAIERQRVRT